MCVNLSIAAHLNRKLTAGSTIYTTFLLPRIQTNITFLCLHAYYSYSSPFSLLLPIYLSISLALSISPSFFSSSHKKYLCMWIEQKGTLLFYKVSACGPLLFFTHSSMLNVLMQKFLPTGSDNIVKWDRHRWATFIIHDSNTIRKI